MIAPLWQDNDLRRRSGRNRVLYEQTCNRTLLAIVRSYVGQGFNPQSAVVVTYDRVYKYLNLWQRIFSRRRAVSIQYYKALDFLPSYSGLLVMLRCFFK